MSCGGCVSAEELGRKCAEAGTEVSCGGRVGAEECGGKCADAGLLVRGFVGRDALMHGRRCALASKWCDRVRAVCY